MPFKDIPHLGLWYTDFLTGETRWSPEMFTIYGLKPNSITPSVEVLMKFTHRDDRDEVSSAIHHATKTLKPFNFFYRITRKDKSLRSVFSAGAFEINADRKPTGRYGICLNLTGLAAEEMKEIKTKLKELELPARTILNDLDSSDTRVELLCSIAFHVGECLNTRIAKASL